MKPSRIFAVQVAGWPARTHRYRADGQKDPTEVSLTFSGQIEAYAEDVGAELLIIGANPDGDGLVDGRVTIEHWDKPTARGLRWYWSELRWALRLLRRARAFRADLVLLDSGVIPFFMMALFTRAGFPVVIILHNTLWPAGFRPSGRKQALLQAIDARFLRKGPRALIAVSPEAGRQVTQLAGKRHVPIFQIRAQFPRSYYAGIPAADPDRTPFEMMFIGRVDESKGVLDIPLMARYVEERAPGRVRWTVCGRGNSLDALRERVVELGLSDIVETPGWVSLEQLHTLYGRSHGWIIPTRSGFAEGLAMTAAESIMAGRPIVSNPIVPALEILADAAVPAKSNDWQSHAEAVLQLATDKALYRRLQAACPSLAEQFFDRDQGLTAALHRILADPPHA